jgi:hypothetical protein
MERKNVERSAVVRSKSQKGAKKRVSSASKSRLVSGSKRMRVREAPVSPDSFGSDATGEDYAEFLRTYDPQESYSQVSSSGGEEGSQITVESRKGVSLHAKVGSDPVRMKKAEPK